MDLIAAQRMRAYPHAQVFRTEDGALRLDLGEPGDELLPEDVFDESVEVEYGDAQVPRVNMRHPLGFIVDELRLVAAQRDEVAQGEALVEFVRRYGPLDLCIHGKPLFHADRPHSVGSCTRDLEQVASTLNFIAAYDAALAVAHSTIHGLPIGKRKLADVKPLLPRQVLHALGERQDLPATSDNSTLRRQISVVAVENLMRETGVTLAMRWRAHRGPTLAFHCLTVTGLFAWYASTQLAREQRVVLYTCSACFAPIAPKRPPRPNEGAYCQTKDCQRVRQANNQRAKRLRSSQGPAQTPS